MSVQDPKNKAEKTESNSSEGKTRAIDDTPTSVEGPPKEVGGRGGLDPSRYGDWEKAGRCIDF